MHKGLKKLCHIFRYSARTRVIIEENSVRIVQRMKNPAARIVFTAEDAEDAEEIVEKSMPFLD